MCDNCFAVESRVTLKPRSSSLLDSKWSTIQLASCLLCGTSKSGAAAVSSGISISARPASTALATVSTSRSILVGKGAAVTVVAQMSSTAKGRYRTGSKIIPQKRDAGINRPGTSSLCGRWARIRFRGIRRAICGRRKAPCRARPSPGDSGRS